MNGIIRHSTNLAVGWVDGTTLRPSAPWRTLKLHEGSAHHTSTPWDVCYLFWILTWAIRHPAVFGCSVIMSIHPSLKL